MNKPELLTEFFRLNTFNGFAPPFGMLKRMPWDDYFITIAAMIASRSTCLRRRYGAVIVKEHKIVSTGYNGAPTGEDHCLDKGCWRMNNNIPHGQQYEKCVSSHAEMSAVVFGRPEDMRGADIYIVGFDCVESKFIPGIPCDICRRLLVNAGIENYITREFGIDGQLIVVKC